MVRSALFEGQDSRGAIDVALHKMPADVAIGSQSALQIDRILGARRFFISKIERFAKKIESELIAAMGADGQTTAIYGDAVTGANLLRDTRRGNSQLRAANPEHGADFFDETSEHRMNF